METFHNYFKTNEFVLCVPDRLIDHDLIDLN